jgi:hypothetical protein
VRSSERDGLSIPKITYARSQLDYERNEQVGNSFFVLDPIVTILFVAHVVISNRPVDQENQKVDGLEVRDRRVESTKQAPRESHEPIACARIFNAHREEATNLCS